MNAGIDLELSLLTEIVDAQRLLIQDLYKKVEAIESELESMRNPNMQMLKDIIANRPSIYKGKEE